MEYRNPFGTASMPQSRSQSATMDVGLRRYMLGIYNYMASALVLTGIVALLTIQMPAVTNMLYAMDGDAIIGIKPMAYVVMFAPLGLVLWLSFGINRMSSGTAQAIFWAYAALMGLSLSTIFLTYTGHSIARVFFITAGTFGAMSLYGYTTKRDLTGLGSFLMMGLIGIIIASVVNLFLHSPAVYFVTSVLGVFIFIGLTAYDTQNLRNMYYQLAGSGEMMAKMTIMGALRLYMDFINLFIYLVQFMGERR